MGSAPDTRKDHWRVHGRNTLDAFPGTFDAIIAIDALHIAVDLEGALRQAIGKLVPGVAVGGSETRPYTTGAVPKRQ